MNIMNRAMTGLYFGLLDLIFASSVFAADQAASDPYPYSWGMWHGMQGHSFWWIFPLLFLILMVAMMVIMMGRCGMGCMWRNKMMGGSEMKRFWGEQSDSALEILNKRYAKGEIDKQEYEEKKAAITVSK